MYRFAANCSPPAPGTRILAGNDPAGDVVYAVATEHGCELLAVVSLVHAAATLLLNGSDPLTRLALPYSFEPS
jgi:hypothetical protein